MNIENFKKTRIKKGLTQKQIADILKVKRGTYANWECGNDLIPIKQIHNLSNFYKLSIDYLLGLNTNNKVIIINKNELNLKQISTNLKYIRKKAKLSQKNFAESININQSTWWAYENGKTLITTHTLIAIYNKYGYSIDYILNNS